MIFKNKLNDGKGESLAETLVALLIGSMALLMLAVAIAASTKINLKTKKVETTDNMVGETVSVVLSVESSGATSEIISVAGYVTGTEQNKYYYYVKTNEASTE